MHYKQLAQVLSVVPDNIHPLVESLCGGVVLCPPLHPFYPLEILTVVSIIQNNSIAALHRHNMITRFECLSGSCVLSDHIQLFYILAFLIIFLLFFSDTQSSIQTVCDS